MTRLSTLVIAVAILLPSPAAAQPIDDSIVEVLVTHQSYDPFQPWNKRRPASRAGYGVVVGKTHVLTTEDLVRTHTLIELRRPRSGKKFSARVEFSDEQVNLALLSIDESPLSHGLHPLEINGFLPDDAALQIVQLDETREIQSDDGQIIRISVDELPNAAYPLLTFHVLTDLNVERPGALALHDNKLAGLIMSYQSIERTGRMLPFPVIKQFMQDAMESPYAGFATAGFAWEPLVDPVKRRYLGLEADGVGILVQGVIPDSGASRVLKPNDVILEWDGHEVTELGYYNDCEFGRLRFPYLIKGYRRPGEEVPVTIIRDREATQVLLTLTRYNDEGALIPSNVTGDQPSYLVEGGFIIRELDQRYLRAYGEDWRARVDARLVYLYNMRAMFPDQPGDKVVIISAVLPDLINVSYQHFVNTIIEKVNGVPIRNINDVFEARDRDGHISRLTLKSNGLDLVLDPDQIHDANRRIQKTYRIAQLRYRRPK